MGVLYIYSGYQFLIQYIICKYFLLTYGWTFQLFFFSAVFPLDFKIADNLK